jgi:predicted small metal-binding protein
MGMTFATDKKVIQCANYGLKCDFSMAGSTNEHKLKGGRHAIFGHSQSEQGF